MKFVSLSIIMSLLVSSLAFGKCLSEDSILIDDKLKTEMDRVEQTGETLKVIVELYPLPPAPESVLPSPGNYDFSKNSEKVRYRIDRRLALIKFAQDFYEPSIVELQKINGLVAPHTTTIGFIVVRGTYNAICEVARVSSVVSLSADYSLEFQN